MAIAKRNLKSFKVTQMSHTQLVTVKRFSMEERFHGVLSWYAGQGRRTVLPAIPTGEHSGAAIRKVYQPDGQVGGWQWCGRMTRTSFTGGHSIGS